MALPLNNSFEGGSNGAAITPANSGGASGSAFDSVVSTLYNTSQSAHGSVSCYCATGTPASSSYVSWHSSIGGGQSTLYGRIYAFFGGNVVSGGSRLVEFWSGGDNNTYLGGIALNSNSLNLAIQDSNFTYQVVFSTTMSLTTWYRIEYNYNFSAGSATVKLFVGDSSTATETKTVTGKNFGGGSAACDTVDMGWAFSASNQPSLYIDDLNVNSTGYPGPATASGPTSTGGFRIASPAFASSGFSSEVASGGIALAPPAFAGTGGPIVPVTSTGGMALAPPAFAAVTQENFPFPKFILGVKIELLINGTWTDISGYAYYRQDIIVSRGRPNWAAGIQASSANLILNNRDGRFSPINTNGPYYPYIQRNVQIRISVVTTSMSLVPYAGYRFNGEVTVWPPISDVTGNDVTCTITAYGILNRYLQGAKLGSPINRYYKKTINFNPTFAPLAWWPCDDATNSASMASGLNGGQGMTFTGTPSFMSDGSFLGSDPIPVVTGSTWHGQTGASANPPGTGSITEITPGTYTITAPPNVSTFTVTEIASGGAGGDTDTVKGGSGGGGGEQVSATIGVTAGKSYTYNVPAGGTAAVGGGGGDGGDAVFTGDTQTLTAHHGKGGGYAGAAVGAGGTGDTLGTHFNGGAGGLGSSSTTSNFTITVNGNPGSTGGGNNHTAAQVVQSWNAPFNVVTTPTVSVVGSGGGGGGGDGSANEGGGVGGGGGAYATGAITVHAGGVYILRAGNGGNGGTGGAGTPGDNGTASGVFGDSGSSVVAGGGQSGGFAGGGGAGGTVTSGSGNSGGNGGIGALSTSSYGGGGGGGGNRGFAGFVGGNGAAGSGRAPGAGNGAGGRGGWGRILTGAGAGAGQTNGQTGNQTGSPGGGGGAGSAATNRNNSPLGTQGGGGGQGQTILQYQVAGVPSGGGGGGSGGSAAVGNAGTGGGLGGTAVTGGGPGGNQGMPGGMPGGGGGGAVPDFVNPAGVDTPGVAPGNGGPGQTTISWNGGISSPVPSNIVSLLLHVDPMGETNGAVLFRFVTYGTINNVDLIYHTGGKLELKGFTGASTFFDSGAISVGADGKSLAVQIQLIANGANITWTMVVLDTISGAVSATATGTANTISLGNVSDVYVNPTATMNSSSATSMGGVAIQQYSDVLANLAPMLSGFDGENSAARIQRLCNEEGIPFTLKGNITDTPQMGPQIDDTFTNLLQFCENADLGLIYEPREAFGIGYRTRLSMCGQIPLVFDYAQAMLSAPFQPVADDQLIRNDITIQRYLGASVTAQQLTGPMSINQPPNGVGDYTDTPTVYLFADSQLLNYSTFRLTLGTQPLYRFPIVNLDLTRLALANLMAAIGTMDIGDYFEVVNAPSWMTPGTIDEIEYGYTENINSIHWNLSINALPEGPYEVPNPPTW